MLIETMFAVVVRDILSKIFMENKTHYTKIFNGNENPILGWKSSRFDVKEKTNTMVNACEKHGACEFKTLIKIS